jgi:HAD superfamily hydrolase (TIGR01484 family)
VKPLGELPAEEALGLQGLLFDLDDTLLSHGVLTREAFSALWDMHEAGLRLVAVTGRPSGWGEVVARQWPIDGAVTENGSAHVVRAGKGVEVIMEGDASLRAERRARLDALVREAAARVPGAPLADDVRARRTDVAWDIGERHVLPADEVEALARLVVSHGARTTRSSVHLHATFDRDDKASGAVRFVGACFGDDAGSALHRWAFVGDSGNDAACFAAFRTTLGVANVRAYVARLSVPPRYVASRERGAGFAEIASALLALRGV